MFMYSNSLKKKMCEEICLNGASTIKTANKYNVPLKTLEKWITSYHKNPNCFDFKNEPSDFRFIDSNPNDISYDELDHNELKLLLLKKDIEIARLKKGYMVKGDGTVKKEFITFFKKNMK